MPASRDVDQIVSRIAAAIGEPARARMLYSLMDGHARTSTELAAVGEITPSTASAHLKRLAAENLVRVVQQGKHRYYRLQGPNVSSVLEGLCVLAGRRAEAFQPRTPSQLRMARTCYDHLAGTAGVKLHDCFQALDWLCADAGSGERGYAVTVTGCAAFAALGIDVDAERLARRRFACGCLDWSERRPHLGGALGAAVLRVAMQKKWVVRHFDSRALDVTGLGRREMRWRFGLNL